MKKVLILSLCAVLCAALTSCEKDQPGVYNPKKKIQKIYSAVDGEKMLRQEWHWNDNNLSSIDFHMDWGEIFTDYYYYDDKNRITMIKEDEDYLRFHYENGLISTVDYYWIDEGFIMQSYKFYYDKKKLSKIEFVTYNLPDKDQHKRKLDFLACLIPQGSEVLNKQINKLQAKQKGDQKIILEFTWEGKNVSRILWYLEGDDECVTEATFTYDNKINPLKGWAQLWLDFVIGTWEDEYFTYASTGNVLTADYRELYNGDEWDRVTTNYTYEYEGDFPVKVTAVMDGDPYFVHYYEY